MTALAWSRHEAWTVGAPGATTEMVPGGTPSVIPESVDTCAGSPPTRTVGADPPGSVETTVVQGLLEMVGGWAQPTIGAPIRSVSRSTAPPPAVTVACFGVRTTVPPWMQMIVSLVVTMGGILEPSRTITAEPRGLPYYLACEAAEQTVQWGPRCASTSSIHIRSIGEGSWPDWPRSTRSRTCGRRTGRAPPSWTGTSSWPTCSCS